MLDSEDVSSSINTSTIDSSICNGTETTIGVVGTDSDVTPDMTCDCTQSNHGFALQVPDEMGSERWIHLAFTWASKSFTLDIAESDRVFDLKAALQSLTDVPPERQKILGLVKGKLPPDQERV